MTTKQRWVLALTSISSLMVALDVTVVSTALSTIRLHLSASVDELEWTVNAYGLSFAVLLMSASALADRYGRRRLYAIGMGIFVAASAACALAPNVGLLIAARAVQGTGAAIIAPTSLSLLSAAFPPARRGAALGIFGGITGIAVLAGPVIGGAVTQGLAWQWIFWLNVPIGLLAIPLVRSHIDESVGPRVPLDLRGLLLVTGASLGLVWGLVRGNASGWGSAEIVGTLAAGVLLTLAFIAYESRTKHPMLPMRLFANRRFASGNAASFLMSASLFSAVFFFAQFQQNGLGQSPLDAGLRLLPWTGTVFIVSPLSGALIGRVGERTLIATGLTMQAIGFAWVALIAKTGMNYAEMIPPLIVAGSGVAATFPAAQNAIMSSVSADEIGTASGSFNMVRQLGGAFGLAIVVAVFTGSGSYGSPGAFTDGFIAATAVSAALSLAGALAGMAIPGRAARAGVPLVPALEGEGA
jgi:EmrB/QacA subfamily drug resistance transporter